MCANSCGNWLNIPKGMMLVNQNLFIQKFNDSLTEPGNREGAVSDAYPQIQMMQTITDNRYKDLTASLSGIREIFKYFCYVGAESPGQRSQPYLR